MRHLSVVILIAFLIVLPSCNFFREKGWFNKKERTLAMLKAQQESIRVADSVRKAQERQLAIENARLDSIRLADEAGCAELESVFEGAARRIPAGYDDPHIRVNSAELSKALLPTHFGHDKIQDDKRNV